MSDARPTPTDAAPPVPPALGDRLRRARQAQGTSLRELGRRLGISASLISQIERGKVAPSVKTLYALVSELDLSFDGVLGVPSDDESGGPGAPSDAPTESDGRRPSPDVAPAGTTGVEPVLVPLPTSARPVVLRADPGDVTRLGSGVSVRDLASGAVPGAQWLVSTYEVGGESCPPETGQQHDGYEWTFVIQGSFGLTVAHEDFELHAGDSVAFDASTPHRFWNAGDGPAVGLWFVLGSRLLPGT